MNCFLAILTVDISTTRKILLLGETKKELISINHEIHALWTLNTNSECLVNGEIHQGKCFRKSEEYEQEFGKADISFVAMLDDLSCDE